MGCNSGKFEVLVGEGETVEMGKALVRIRPGEAVRAAAAPTAEAAAVSERGDLARYRERRRLTTDAARPEAVAKRHARGQRTARENVADLCVPGSFQEYGLSRSPRSASGARSRT